MRSIPSVVLATTLLSLLPTAAAEAKDYCVAKPRCTGAVISAAQLQASLTEAQSNGTADRFFLGDALFAAGPYGYRSAEAVEIHGVSGTTLQSKVDDRVVLTVDGAAATVAGLKLELVRPGSAGLRLIGGAASDVTVVQTLGTSAGVGVLLDDGATLTGASVAMHEGTTPAVGTLSGAAAVRDSVLASAGSGVTVAQGAQVTVERVRITAPLGVQAVNGRAIVRDTLIDGRGGDPNGLTAGIAVQGVTGGVAAVDAARVTIAGSGEGDPTAIGAYALGADSGAATLRIADSAIAGTGIPLVRVAQGGTATLIADRVAHRDRVAGEPEEGGPGTTTETNRLPAPTGFVDAAGGDFRLLPGSPLVDAGDPAFTPDASSDRDVSGAPRLADGDGDCTPRVDVGAYELQRPLPHAVATAAAASAPAGAAVSFSAAGSCAGDPAAPLTYVWQFDDGGSAAGVTAAHAFATAGTHAATVTVIDPAGRQASATAQVATFAPPAQPVPAPRPDTSAADRTAPKLTALRAPARIASGNALPRLPAGRRAPAFAFRLSEAATVRLRFARRGRDGRFRAVRTVLSVRAAKGANRLGFGGRLTRKARLAPGGYRVTMIATDAAGNRSQPATARFQLRAKR